MAPNAQRSAPLIAIVGRRLAEAPGFRTGAIAAGERYIDALARAGAVAATLTPADIDARGASALMQRFDGLVLLGGGDIDSSRYGEALHAEAGGVDPLRDTFEFALVRAAIDDHVPTLAICRGMQVLNVACGGSLDQHITDRETTIHHRGHRHDVTIDSGSRLAAVIGATAVDCSSSHHQAVARLGDDLTITARAADGVVEAIEHNGSGWIVGVQWHPEDTAAEDPVQQRLFDAFVREAARGSH